MYRFIYRGMMTHGNYDDMSHKNNKEEDERRIEKEGRWVSVEKGMKKKYA